MKTYEDFPDGWTPVVSKNLQMACCDCGLTHTIHIRKRGNGFEMKVDRDNRVTALMRRHNEYDCKPKC